MTRCRPGDPWGSLRLGLDESLAVPSSLSSLRRVGEDEEEEAPLAEEEKRLAADMGLGMMDILEEEEEEALAAAAAALLL